MNAVSFTRWVNDHLLPNSILEPGFPRHIGVETGRKWLHELGFEGLNKKKGVYIDGHEREDVVKHRRKFLCQLVAGGKMCFQMISSLLQQSEDKKIYSFFMMK